mgnify:CR=1 FL=1
MAYDGHGKLLNAAQSFYVGNKACVRIGNEVSLWFSEMVGVCQCCFMSPLLFKLYMDVVMREVQAEQLE